MSTTDRQIDQMANRTFYFRSPIPQENTTMIRSRFLLASLAAVTLGFTASTASAQVTANNDVNVTVGTLLKLTLSTASITAPAPGITEFDAGQQDVAGPSATVKSNRKWSLDMVGSSTTVWATSPVGYSKAASDLKWGICSAGTYPNTAAASAQVENGATGTTGATANVCYRILWSYAADIPGAYKVTLVYTLTGL